MRIGIISCWFVVVIMFFSGIALGGESFWGDWSDHCRVLELTRIHRPNEFTCRVDQWKGIDKLLLRVTIRDLLIPKDAAEADRLRQWIVKKINESRYVMLYDIQARNYFRVIAGIKIDRIDLLDLLRQEGFIPAEIEIPEVSKNELSDLESSALLNLSGTVGRDQSKLPTTEQKADRFYTQQTLQEVLRKEVDLSGLDSDTSLRDALEAIRLSVDPPLPLVVLWNDLRQNLFIDPDMPIRVGGLKTVPLKLALEMILSSVTGGRVKAVLFQEDNLLLVVSSRFASRQMKTQVYDIHELAAIPASAGETASDAGRTTNSGYAAQ